MSTRPLGWVANAFPAPALAPAARGRSVEGDSSRNEVPFNLGALGELLTCHWHPLILKRKNSASQGTPRRERWGRGRPTPPSTQLCPALLRSVELSFRVLLATPSVTPLRPGPAHPDCSASAREPMGSSRPPAPAANHRRKC